jgi:hypothetical protein
MHHGGVRQRHVEDTGVEVGGDEVDELMGEAIRG